MKRKVLAKATFGILCGLILWLVVGTYVIASGQPDETLNEQGYRSFVSLKSWLGIAATMSGVAVFFWGIGELFK
jgi:hypothetical protein